MVSEVLMWLEGAPGRVLVREHHGRQSVLNAMRICPISRAHIERARPVDQGLSSVLAVNVWERTEKIYIIHAGATPNDGSIVRLNKHPKGFKDKKREKKNEAHKSPAIPLDQVVG